MMECRLAGLIHRCETIRQREAALIGQLDEEAYDLWQACRWADRLDRCRRRLAVDQDEITRLWQEIWRRVTGLMASGQEPTELDRFFFWAWPFRSKLMRGDLSLVELDGGYDWLRGCFRPEFSARHLPSPGG